MTQNLVIRRFSEQRCMILNLCTFLGHPVDPGVQSQSKIGVNATKEFSGMFCYREIIAIASE